MYIQTYTYIYACMHPCMHACIHTYIINTYAYTRRYNMCNTFDAKYTLFPAQNIEIYFNGRKEGIVLFNNALSTFYLWLYGVKHMVNDHSDSEREETCCRHMGYSFRLAARVLLYASSHRQDNTYHGLCYTSRGALAGTRNSSMGSP